MSRKLRRVAAVAFAGATLVAALVSGAAPADGLTGKALILEDTVSGGAASIEANAATALGLTVEVKTAAEWAAMTQPEFASYRVIILGDATCGGSKDAAEANAATWGPVVNGNVLLVGTDPVFHSGQGGAELTNSGIGFAAAAEGKTGLYATLSCYYHGTAPGTPVPLLAPFGTFTVTGVGCFNDAHIVASHPALTGLTDDNLSNWSCSVHEAFDAYPTNFLPLAIAEGAEGVQYLAADGTSGIPYIMARGEGLSASDISLSPVTATLDVGQTHTLTAEVKSGGVAQEGVVVTFATAAGSANPGLTLTATTGADGKASVSYTSAVNGTDTWTASFTRDTITQTSNTVTVAWTGAPAVAATTTTPTTAAPAPTVAPAAELPRTGGASTEFAWLGTLAIAVGLGLALRKRVTRLRG